MTTSTRSAARSASTPTPTSRFRPTTRDDSKQVDYTHSSGQPGLVQPSFGTTTAPVPPSQDVLDAVVQRHLDQRAYGADWIETGYVERGAATLAQHLWLADNLSAAGMFLPMSGVSDDHRADQAMTTQTKRFAACVYAATTNDTELLAQQKTGRSFQRKVGTGPGRST